MAYRSSTDSSARRNQIVGVVLGLLALILLVSLLAYCGGRPTTPSSTAGSPSPVLSISLSSAPPEVPPFSSAPPMVSSSPPSPHVPVGAPNTGGGSAAAPWTAGMVTGGVLALVAGLIAAIAAIRRQPGRS
jgi:hypothetical protein